jgi:hypothetical protein
MTTVTAISYSDACVTPAKARAADRLMRGGEG